MLKQRKFPFVIAFACLCLFGSEARAQSLDAFCAEPGTAYELSNSAVVETVSPAGPSLKCDFVQILQDGQRIPFVIHGLFYGVFPPNTANLRANTAEWVEQIQPAKLFPLSVGKTYNTSYARDNSSWNYRFRVLKFEPVEIKAGKFDAFLVEVVESSLQGNYTATGWRWISAASGHALKWDWADNRGQKSTWELTRILPPGASRAAPPPSVPNAPVSVFLGSWEGVWQGGDASTLAVVDIGGGKAGITYTYGRQRYTYVGTSIGNTLQFGAGGYHYIFSPPGNDRLMQGTASGPGFTSAIAMKSTSAAAVPGPSAAAANKHWLVGIWVGSLPDPNNPLRALEVDTVSDDGAVKGRWGLGVGRTGEVKVMLAEESVEVTTQAASRVLLKRADDTTLIGEFILKDGRSTPITLKRQ